jgi:hypothetical protein
MSKTREFRVGDRVVCEERGIRTYGKTGTIMYIDGSDIGVEFDGDFDGHTLGGRIKSKRGWYVHEDHITHIPKFKVGDKVKVLDGKNIPNYTFGWGMNRHIGNVYTIKKVDETISDGRIGYRMEECLCTWDERGLELVEEKDVKQTTKYKVGDRVRVRKDLTTNKSYKMMDSSSGYVAVGSMFKFVGKDVTISKVFGDYYHIEENNLKWTDEMFEGLASECEEPSKGKIVIYVEGRDVIAKNTETGETAKATCHPDDEFDFNIGAKLAFERLITPKLLEEFEPGKRYVFRKELFLKERNMTHPGYTLSSVTEHWVNECDGMEVDVINKEDARYSHYFLSSHWCEELEEVPKKVEEPKLYNGKVVCVASDIVSVTVGKIYEFVDGVATSDRGIRFTDKPIKSLDELHEKLPSIKVIEVVE